MATLIRQTVYTQGGTPASVMTNTDLASLATGGYAESAAAFDNSVNLDAWGDFFLTLGTFGTAPTANTTIDLYILPTTDGGTTFPGYDATNKFVQGENKACFFSLEAQTVLPVLFFRNVPLPPCKFKVVAVNNSGQSLAATGNSLTVLTHSMQSG